MSIYEKSVVWCFRRRWGGKVRKNKRRKKDKGREGVNVREEGRRKTKRKMRGKDIATLIIFISMHVV